MIRNDALIVDFSKEADAENIAVDILGDAGVVQLRNIFDPETVDYVARRSQEVFSNPSLGGSFGYYQKAYGKRFYDPLLLGGPTVDLLVNNIVTSLVEKYINGGIFLAETFLKYDEEILGELNLGIHADFSVGYKDGENPALTENELKNPLGVGGVIYLHDTSKGSFCFSLGSHKYGAPFGGLLDKRYSDDFVASILDSMIILPGKKGDIILFDDRGFHGPEIQTESARLSLLIDYFKREEFSYRTRTPMPALLNDLGQLNEKQLRILGLGSNFSIPYEEYHIRTFRDTKGYKIVQKAFTWQFAYQYRKYLLKKSIKKLLLLHKAQKQ